VNLTKYIFNFQCESIKEHKKVIPYGRLLSELFYQSRLVQILEDAQADEDLGIIYGKAFNGETLGNMGIRGNVIDSRIPFSVMRTNPIYNDRFAIFSTLDNEEVIKNYIQNMRAEGIDIKMENIPDAPANMYKEPKKRKALALTIQNSMKWPTQNRTNTSYEEIYETVDSVTIKESRTRRGKVILKVVVVEALKSKSEKKKISKKVQTQVSTTVEE